MQTQTQSMNKARTQTAKQIVGFSRISRELISQDFTFKSNQTGKQKRDPSSECAVQLGKKKKKHTFPPSFNLFLCFQRMCANAAKASGNASHLSGGACGKHTNMCPSALLHRRTHVHTHTYAGDNGGGVGGRGWVGCVKRSGGCTLGA